MPVATEVDDLERQIVRLEEEIRRRKTKVIQLSNDIEEAHEYVERCKASADLCKENLKKLKSESLVSLEDFRDMQKLYEDNMDLMIQHKAIASNKIHERTALLKEQIPFLESSLSECKCKLSKWGQVVPFKMR